MIFITICSLVIALCFLHERFDDAGWADDVLPGEEELDDDDPLAVE